MAEDPVLLKADALIQPKGLLASDLFSNDDPDGNTISRVRVWLPLGYAEASGIDSAASQDKAAASYVYYRAFEAKANQLAAIEAESRSASGTSSKWTKEQYGYYADLAAKHKSQFDAYLEDESGDMVVTIPTTVAVRTESVW
jgi:hypothetical protein